MMVQSPYPGAIPPAPELALTTVLPFLEELDLQLQSHKYFLRVYQEIQPESTGDPKRTICSELEEMLEQVKHHQFLPEIRDSLVRYVCARVEASRLAPAHLEFIDPQFLFAQNTLFDYLIVQYRSQKDIDLTTVKIYEELLATLFRRGYLPDDLHSNAAFSCGQLKQDAQGWNLVHNHEILRSQAQEKIDQIFTAVEKQEQALLQAIEKVKKHEQRRWRRHEGAQIIATVLLIGGIFAATYYLAN